MEQSFLGMQKKIINPVGKVITGENMTFNELYLNEGIGPRTLYHYTTYSALENILEMDKPALKAHVYEGTPKGKLQISFVRPSMSNQEKVEELSSGAKGGVRIIIDGSKITDKVRGAKIKTIAELPVMFKNELIKHTGIKNPKQLNLFIKRGMDFLEKNQDETGESEEFESFLAKNGIVKNSKREKKYIKNDLARYKSYTSSREREGEERITVPKYKKYISSKEKEGAERITIPKYSVDLDPSYSKIELIKEPDMIYRKNDSGSFYRKKIAKLMKKHSKLFKHNDIYKSFIKELDESTTVSLKDLISINEGIGPRTLYHYTTLKNLYNILKDKKINANKYLGTPESSKQISTVRKSMDNINNRENLSRGANGGVKIIIDASKITDKIRGTKIKTIAELPVMYENGLREFVGLKKSKELRNFIDDIVRLLRRHKIDEENYYEKSKDSKVIKDYKKTVLKNMKDSDEIKKLNKRILGVLSHLTTYKNLLNNREGEERITLKGDSLPLNPDYIKIELTKDDLFGFNYLQKIELAKRIRENKEFFKHNDVFKKIIKIKEPEPQYGMYKGRY